MESQPNEVKSTPTLEKQHVDKDSVSAAADKAENHKQNSDVQNDVNSNELNPPINSSFEKLVSQETLNHQETNGTLEDRKISSDTSKILDILNSNGVSEGEVHDTRVPDPNVVATISQGSGGSSGTEENHSALKTETMDREQLAVKRRTKSKEPQGRLEDVVYGGWVERTDEKTGRTVYYNVHTKQMTFDKPSEPKSTSISEENQHVTVDGASEEEKKFQDGAKPSLNIPGVNGNEEVIVDQRKLLAIDESIPGRRPSEPVFVSQSLELKTAEAKSTFEELRRNSDSVFQDTKEEIRFYTQKGAIVPYQEKLKDILTNLKVSSYHNSLIAGTNQKQYTLLTYAKENFQKQKIPYLLIFKRDLKPEEQIKWSKLPMKTTLHFFPERKDEEGALKAYALVKNFIYNGRKNKTPADQETEVANLKAVLDICLNYVSIRNEVIMYAIKEANGNPDKASEIAALQLLCALISCFAPIKVNFQQALAHFFSTYDCKNHEETKKYIQSLQVRLQRAIVIGSRKSVPHKKYIASFLKPDIPLPLFGVSIEEYFAWQFKKFPEESAPFILKLLSDKMLLINAFKEQGIFRLPGEFEIIEKVKDALIEGDFDIIKAIDDPHILASLFKLWLRELSEPLVPKTMYDECLKVADNRDECLAFLLKLPDLNKSVAVFVTKFLGSILTDDFYLKTKMDVENIAVVFTPNYIRTDVQDPRIIMKNAPKEKLFVKNIILSSQTPKADDEESDHNRKQK